MTACKIRPSTKDFSIAVVDARRGMGNGHVFPAGPLRAPLAAQIAAMRMRSLWSARDRTPPTLDQQHARGRALLHARLEPDRERAQERSAHKKVLAFAGIGDPEKFFSTLAAAGIEAAVGAELSRSSSLYARRCTNAFCSVATAERLVPVTTEKDLVRLTGEDETIARLRARAQALPVTLVVEEEDDLRKLLRQALAARARIVYFAAWGNCRCSTASGEA